MKSACEPFLGKKITLMGLGILGRGMGDAAFLAKCGAHVVVTDTKTAEELKESVEALKEYSNIELHLGGHAEADFTGADLVIKAAGVPLDSPYIEAARNAGVSVAMSTALFAKYAMEAGAQVVGVTGTRGKSTVTHMIYHSLLKAGKKTLLGGNVRGLSTLAQLHDVEADDICVLELDSWQLQGFGDLKISPNIALFTNLMPDHQNYYPDMNAYYADKANIFIHQKEGGIVIAGKDIEGRIRSSRADVITPSPLPGDLQLRIPGEHNRQNAAFAFTALKALGLAETDIRTGLESFEGVEGRLQYVGEVRGVKIYNDNNATTPEATIAALHALNDGHRKSVILIAGGSDKGLRLEALADEIARSCKTVLLLAGTGTVRLSGFLAERGENCMIYHTIPEALDAALGSAEAGDIVLFSPAFASFGTFKNEYDRNDRFLAAVRELKR